MSTIKILSAHFNPWEYKGGRVAHTPHKVFLKIFQDELLSRSAVFSSCSHIPRHILTHVW